MDLIKKRADHALVPLDEFRMTMERDLRQLHLQTLICQQRQQFLNWSMNIQFGIPGIHELLHFRLKEGWHVAHGLSPVVTLWCKALGRVAREFTAGRWSLLMHESFFARPWTANPAGRRAPPRLATCPP